MQTIVTRAQACPLCKQENDIIIMGHFPHPEIPVSAIFSNYNGYSFCNCRNIFYTDWSNIKQSVYNIDYYDKYNNEGVNDCYKSMAEFYGPRLLPSVYENIYNVLDVGSINPSILNYFRDRSCNTSGLDIHSHPLDHPTLGKHKLYVGDFESYCFAKDKFDIIWASHIFEHFKDPIAAIRKCNTILNKDGKLFIAMPDPYFIDFTDTGKFGHWHLSEHHILWDMDSFCDTLEENGFKVEFKHRNADVGFICNLDYGIIARKINDNN